MIEIILLSIGLAMDASAIGMADGLIEPQMNRRKVIIIATSFGIFQALMPLIGYLIGSIFTTTIAPVIPWIAMLILGFLGIKMIITSFKPEEIVSNKLDQKTLLIQSIATSIDALAVGIIFVGLSMIDVITNLLVIGSITFGLVILAIVLGKKVGTKFSNKAQLLGGIILIIVGLQILLG